MCNIIQLNPQSSKYVSKISGLTRNAIRMQSRMKRWYCWVRSIVKNKILNKLLQVALMMAYTPKEISNVKLQGNVNCVDLNWKSSNRRHRQISNWKSSSRRRQRTTTKFTSIAGCSEANGKSNILNDLHCPQSDNEHGKQKNWKIIIDHLSILQQYNRRIGIVPLANAEEMYRLISKNFSLKLSQPKARNRNSEYTPRAFNNNLPKNKKK